MADRYGRRLPLMINLVFYSIIEVLTGFLGPSEEAFGRPVGVVIAKDGALLVADDVGNAVWRVTAADAECATQ